MNHTLRIEHTWETLTHTEIVELSYHITETGSLEVQHGDRAICVLGHAGSYGI